MEPIFKPDLAVSSFTGTGSAPESRAGIWPDIPWAGVTPGFLKEALSKRHQLWKRAIEEEFRLQSEGCYGLYSQRDPKWCQSLIPDEMIDFTQSMHLIIECPHTATYAVNISGRCKNTYYPRYMAGPADLGHEWINN